MKSDPQIEKEILTTLFKHGCIGKQHTSIIDVCRNLNQYSTKDIKISITSLRKQELLDLYKTYYGLDIRLIPSNMDKVKEIIEFEDSY